MVQLINQIKRKAQMKLDRNNPTYGRGKYALIPLRKTKATREDLKALTFTHPEDGATTVPVQFGDTSAQNEFFVIKLQDKNAPDALRAYAMAAEKNGDAELAQQVLELAIKSRSLNQKMPD